MMPMMLMATSTSTNVKPAWRDRVESGGTNFMSMSNLTLAPNFQGVRTNIKNDHEPLNIRPVTEVDIPLVLEFIRDIAEYERLLDQWWLMSHLRESFFGPRAKAEIDRRTGW